ncbi:MAG TPA: GAF domain-containing sensor histidine kinase [Longimicrobiales bacterium]|nr:GAF domain-containing sensor histidine kinase [Longimicrobiales bacterium]
MDTDAAAARRRQLGALAQPDAEDAGSAGRAQTGDDTTDTVPRTELERAQRRAAFLSEASSILVATSLDFETTLKALSRLAVSRLADWCAIHSIDAGGTLVRAVVSHRDPSLEKPLTEIVDRALNDRWRSTVRSVAGTGRSQVQAQLKADTWFETAGIDPGLLDRVATGSAMITPLTGRGDVLGAITLVTNERGRQFDDQELGLAEELGRRAAIALDNARLYRQAHEANRVKADFLAVMSHELRTPLNAIMGYTDLLDAGVSGDLNDRQHHQLDRIRASARHLLQLIEEILSFARMEAGAEEVQLEKIRAAALVHDAAAEIQSLAESKGLSFKVDIQDEAVTIHTDPAKARQVLMNLLSNAVKFTERGEVTLRLRADDSRVHFDIIDTGIGIPQEQMDRIYDPFWQLERPNTRRVGGTGLGLSVSRRYTRLLRGDLAVESRPGKGTSVTVSLPLDRETPPPDRATRDRGDDATAGPRDAGPGDPLDRATRDRETTPPLDRETPDRRPARPRS